MPVFHFQFIDYFDNIIEKALLYDEQMKKFISIYNPFLNDISIFKKIQMNHINLSYRFR
jgi:hypothetical protein